MCDTVAGELILSFSKLDIPAQNLVREIREGLIENVTHIESLEDRLRHLHLRPIEDLGFDFHRVRVPIGDEQWKITYLQFFYKIQFLNYLSSGYPTQEFMNSVGRSDHQFTVAPNHLLTLNANAGAPVQAAQFQFSTYHNNAYKSMMGISSPINAKGVKIVIIDSGVASDVTFTINQKRNFADPNNAFDVTDNYGHGTVVSLLINEVVSDADIDIYKITDTKNASEWDTLAAVAACKDAHVINMSLEFGLGDKACQTCGRESHSSRSAVFERMIEQLFRQPNKPIVIAAAGNNTLPSLAYPARFGDVIAIGSVNSRGDLSHFSNYGDVDHILNYHANRFVLPGGEDDPTRPESVGMFTNPVKSYHGTSFAAAYASGIVAASIAQAGIYSYQPNSIISTLRQSADTSILTNYDRHKHGNGIMKL